MIRVVGEKLGESGSKYVKGKVFLEVSILILFNIVVKCYWKIK